MSNFRLIALCSALSFLPASSPVVNYDINTGPLPSKILKSSVWLSPTPMPGVGIGTGIAVQINGKKAILTAEHVAAALPFPVDICSFYDECIRGISNYISDSSSSLDTDWAAYFVEEFPEGIRAARISRREPAIGDELWSAGRAFGDSSMVVKGTLAWVEQANGRKIYILNTYSVPGFSGGGVFNTKGELVGITVAIRVNEIGTQENFVLVVPISELDLF
jgi:hypothetical protein